MEHFLFVTRLKVHDLVMGSTPWKRHKISRREEFNELKVVQIRQAACIEIFGKHARALKETKLTENMQEH